MGIWLPPAEMSLLSWCCHKGMADLSISILHHCPPLSPPLSLYHLFQTTNSFPAIPYSVQSVIFLFPELRLWWICKYESRAVPHYHAAHIAN